MDDPQVLLTELRESREHAAALVRARLDAVANQIQELANRTVGELQLVLPPDLEVLFPLAQIAPKLEALAAPPPPPPAPVVAELRCLGLEPVRALDAGKAQSEVLQELLRQLGAWAGARAIVVFRDGQAAGWAGAGFVGSDPVRSWRGAINESPVLAKVSEGIPVLITVDGDALLSEWIGGDGGGKLLAVPMLLRGKVVGTLLAVEGEDGLDTVVVQQLTFVVGLLLETLSVRAGIPSATIAEPLDLSAPVAIPTIEPEAPGQAVFGGPPDEYVEVEQATIPPEEMLEAVDAGATVHLKMPVTPVVPPPPERTPEEQKRHDEAKRFARLLVSEIRLYNEQAVQEGKRTKDIYRRLREDVDRSREMFDQRVPADIRAQSNYFQEELVRLLADGDPEALGM